jgi:hypothetical protein
MAIYAEQHRFLPVLSAGSGARIASSSSTTGPRASGSSKYGLGRALRVVLDLVAIKFIVAVLAAPDPVLRHAGAVDARLGLVFAAWRCSARTSARARSCTANLLSFNDWEMAVVTILCWCSRFVYFALLGLLASWRSRPAACTGRSTLDRILNELH